eukprot:gene19608-27770_t
MPIDDSASDRGNPVQTIEAAAAAAITARAANRAHNPRPMAQGAPPQAQAYSARICGQAGKENEAGRRASLRHRLGKLCPPHARCTQCGTQLAKHGFNAFRTPPQRPASDQIRKPLNLANSIRHAFIAKKRAAA